MNCERLSKTKACMLSLFVLLIGSNWSNTGFAQVTKDKIISSKEFDNLDYCIINRNRDTVVKLQTFTIQKAKDSQGNNADSKSDVKADSNVKNQDSKQNSKDDVSQDSKTGTQPKAANVIKNVVDSEEIAVPKGYYVMKYNYGDLDNDGNKEFTVVLKNQYGDYCTKIYCYRVINNKLVLLPLNNKGRRITYPYYKEDVEFYNNCIAIYYVNKYIDISNAKFQLIYREKYSVSKKEATLASQENYVINSPSNRDLPNFKQSKYSAYSFGSRSRMDELKAYDSDFKSIAKKYRIPTAVLKAVAMSESSITQSIDGTPLVSFDGGIGIMQITPQGYMSDINKIAYSPIYNIEKGAQELCEKWNYKYKNIIPKTDNDNRNIIENWYFALWAYNGWHKMNNPNMVPYHTDYGLRTYAYQEKVLGTVGNLMGTKITLFDAKKSFPKTGLPSSSKVFDTPSPYHYGDIGQTLAERDTNPTIDNVKYNPQDNSIVWNFVDKDYGDYLTSYGIKIVNESNNNNSTDNSNDKKITRTSLTISGKPAASNVDFYKIPPKTVEEYYCGKSWTPKYVIKNKLDSGEYSAYIFVQDRFGVQSDLYKVPIKVNNY